AEHREVEPEPRLESDVDPALGDVPALGEHDAVERDEMQRRAQRRLEGRPVRERDAQPDADARGAVAQRPAERAALRRGARAVLDVEREAPAVPERRWPDRGEEREAGG